MSLIRTADPSNTLEPLIGATKGTPGDNAKAHIFTGEATLLLCSHLPNKLRRN